MVQIVKTPRLPSKLKASGLHSGATTPSENQIHFSGLNLLAKGTTVNTSATRVRNVDIDKIIKEATMANNETESMKSRKIEVKNAES